VSATVLYMSMTLDGFIAGPNAGRGNGLGDGGERLHEWSFNGQMPVFGQVFDEFMATGAIVAGRGTFEPAGGWRGDHHDGVPIWVLSRREPGIDVSQWPLVTYVTDLGTAMTGAKRAAGDKNVLVHGAATAQLALAAGLLDELEIHLIPSAPRPRAPPVRQPRARAHRTTAHPNPRGRGRCHTHALPRPALSALFPLTTIWIIATGILLSRGSNTTKRETPTRRSAPSSSATADTPPASAPSEGSHEIALDRRGPCGAKRPAHRRDPNRRAPACPRRPWMHSNVGGRQHRDCFRLGVGFRPTIVLATQRSRRRWSSAPELGIAKGSEALRA
jgi:dihydrofolate reductase